ncbi:hypothetical protein [Inediibacterium massiliense]|uniref:hypothetical protein n=1 Tax=Inediibacterium massiliense TaxID=1658111 RepID=UPI0006B4FA9C|nr:hypothetical protein [Inediibacterium massiliense]
MKYFLAIIIAVFASLLYETLKVVDHAILQTAAAKPYVIFRQIILVVFSVYIVLTSYKDYQKLGKKALITPIIFCIGMGYLMIITWRQMMSVL